MGPRKKLQIPSGGEQTISLRHVQHGSLLQNCRWLHDSWLSSLAVFVGLVLRQLLLDGISPFLCAMCILQFFLTSMRAWRTLLPIMIRLVVESTKVSVASMGRSFAGRCKFRSLQVIAHMVQHTLVKQQMANRSALRLTPHGTFEKVRRWSTCARVESW